MDQLPAFLSHCLEYESIDELSLEQILDSFTSDPRLQPSSQGISASMDPRSGETVLYTPARAKRPHDYEHSSETRDHDGADCPICNGQGTGILDWEALSSGVTFINKNLYPVLPPPDLKKMISREYVPEPQGLHFLQWTSSEHSRDWYNLSMEDCTTAMHRLVLLEKTLVNVSGQIEERKLKAGLAVPEDWYVSIIKNAGSAVGGSLEHGHQQILLGNQAPVRILQDQRFVNMYGISFPDFLRKNVSRDLMIRDYGQAVLMVVPFMRRPYEMILLPADSRKQYFHELEEAELVDMIRGWRDASRILRWLMPRLGREAAFNVVCHNGPGSSLYVEFLPYTQEEGGLEKLGLNVCQMAPEQAAQDIRGALNRISSATV